MSTVIAHHEFLAAANILGGTLTAYLPQSFADLSLQIDIPDFGLDLVFPVIELNPELESGVLDFKVAFDADSTFAVELAGELFREQDEFQIQEVSLNIGMPTKGARSIFILSSLRAMLSLAEQVRLRIPELRLDLILEFNEPLLEISQMLRRRLIAYRIMVIERSTGYIFQIPADISGEQVKNITLIYNAIVHRSFVWPIADIGYGLPATKEALNYLLTLNQLTSATFPGYPITIPLFDKVISLGHANITIHDKIIENFNEIQKEMAHDDGHIVKFVVRSLSGHGRYDMSEAPRLPDKPWDEKIERLIDLEGQLDAAIVAKYHTLAASTLEGLSEEEKAAITARPELDENAFVD